MGCNLGVKNDRVGKGHRSHPLLPVDPLKSKRKGAGGEAPSPQFKTAFFAGRAKRGPDEGVVDQRLVEADPTFDHRFGRDRSVAWHDALCPFVQFEAFRS